MAEPNPEELLASIRNNKQTTEPDPNALLASVRGGGNSTDTGSKDGGAYAPSIPTGYEGMEYERGSNPIAEAVSKHMANLSADFAMGYGNLIQGTGKGMEWAGIPGGQTVSENGQGMIDNIADPNNASKPGQYGVASDVLQSLPFTIATMPIGLGGAALGGRAAAALGGGKIAQTVGTFAGMGVPTAAFEGGTEAGDAYQQALQEGRSEEEARQIGNEVFAKNLTFLTASNALQFAPFTKAGREALANIVPGKAAALAEKMPAWMKSNKAKVGATLGAEIGSEGLEETSQENFKRGSLGQETQWNPANWDDEMWRNFNAGAAMGGMFAAGAHVMGSGRDALEEQRANAPNPTDLLNSVRNQTPSANMPEDIQSIIDGANKSSGGTSLAVAEGVEDSDLSHTNASIVQRAEALNKFAIDNFGQPLTVSGGWRSPENNARSNGAENSRHLSGGALDISTEGLNDEQRQLLFKMAGELGFDTNEDVIYHDRGSGYHMHLQDAGSQQNAQQGRMSKEAFFNAVAGQESGGDYSAENGRTGAFGKYQIMPDNWPSWSQEAGLEEGAPMTPENQEKVARYKLGDYYDKYGPEGALVAWYSGEGNAQRWAEGKSTAMGENGEYSWDAKQGKGDEPSIREYVQQSLGRAGAQPGRTESGSSIADSILNSPPMFSTNGGIIDFASDKYNTSSDPGEVNFFADMMDKNDKFINTPENRKAVEDKYGDELKAYLAEQEAKQDQKKLQELAGQNQQPSLEYALMEAQAKNKHAASLEEEAARLLRIDSSSAQGKALLEKAGAYRKSAAEKTKSFSNEETKRLQQPSQHHAPAAQPAGLHSQVMPDLLQALKKAQAAKFDQAEEGSIDSYIQREEEAQRTQEAQRKAVLAKKAARAEAEQRLLQLTGNQGSIITPSLAEQPTQASAPTHGFLQTAEDKIEQKQRARVTDALNAGNIRQAVGLAEKFNRQDLANIILSSQPQQAGGPIIIANAAKGQKLYTTVKETGTKSERREYGAALANVVNAVAAQRFDQAALQGMPQEHRLFYDFLKYYEVSAQNVLDVLHEERDNEINQHMEVMRNQWNEPGTKAVVARTEHGTPITRNYSGKFQWQQQLEANGKLRKAEIEPALRKESIRQLSEGYIDPKYGEQVPQESVAEWNTREAAIHGIEDYIQRAEPFEEPRATGQDLRGSGQDDLRREVAQQAIAYAGTNGTEGSIEERQEVKQKDVQKSTEIVKGEPINESTTPTQRENAANQIQNPEPQPSQTAAAQENVTSPSDMEAALAALPDAQLNEIARLLKVRKAGSKSRNGFVERIVDSHGRSDLLSAYEKVVGEKNTHKEMPANAPTSDAKNDTTEKTQEEETPRSGKAAQQEADVSGKEEPPAKEEPSSSEQTKPQTALDFDVSRKEALKAKLLAKSKPKKLVNVVDDSDAALAEALADLKDSLNNLSANPMFNPDLMGKALRVGLIYAQRGVNNFAEWSGKMTDAAGDKITPYLPSTWSMINSFPEGKKFDADTVNELFEYAGIAHKEGHTTEEALSKVIAEDLGEEYTPFAKMAYNGIKGIAKGGERDYDEHGRHESVPEVDSKRTETIGSGRKQSGNGKPSGNASDRDVEGKPSADGEESGTNENTSTNSIRAYLPGRRSDNAVSESGNELPGRRRTSPSRISDAVAGSGRKRGRKGQSAGAISDDVRREQANGEGISLDVAEKQRPNYHIENPEELIGGTPKVRFAKNKAAIEAFLSISEDGHAPTQEELDAMAAYTGWGSFGQELFQGNWENPRPKNSWEKEDTWLREHLGKAEWESAQRSIINAHYTDPVTVQTMWNIAQKMGFDGGRVLEPSMGVGNFFGMMPLGMMEKSKLTGIELDTLTGGMAKILYPDANIQIKGYQDSKTADNFYDFVIGNFPFASQAPADRRYINLSPTLHDFFFLKALDQTRPGGIVMSVTSAGTMDKKSKSVRLALAKKAELVAAFRLPSGAFEKYAGTSVVTDILIFKKRETPQTDFAGEQWIDLGETTSSNGKKFTVNQYFIDNPNHVLGTLDYGSGSPYGVPSMIVRRPGNLQQLMESLPNKVQAGTYQEVKSNDNISYVSNNTDEREGSLIVENGKIMVVKGDVLAPADQVKKYSVKSEKETANREVQIKRLIEIRKAYGKTIDAERADHPETEAYRKELKAKYDSFVKEYGSLEESWGRKYFKKIDDPFAPLLQALEYNGEAAGVFTKRTVRSVRKIENPSIRDAFVEARNNAVGVDLEAIAERSSKTVEEVKKDLLESGAVFKTPNGNYEVSDVYLSGNVRTKLREAQDALEAGDTDMAHNIQELKKVIPKNVPYFKIEAKLGAPWVGLDEYKGFVAHLLGVNSEEGIEVTNIGGSYKVSFGNRSLNSRAEATTKWGVSSYNFDKMLTAAFNNTAIKITYKDEDGKSAVDEEESKKANDKVDQIRSEFPNWIWKDSSRKIKLENNYNEMMNAVATPHYDGSFLEFPGMALERGDSPFSLRQHQANAIWRGIANNKGIYAHEVGTGKTFTMAGIAVESRRFGVARKPLILAHNANSEAVAQEFNMMYPGAKVLYISNLGKDKEVNLRRIANEDWDAIVLPHSLIDNLTLKEETLMALAAEEIANMEAAAIEAAKEDGVDLDIDRLEDEEYMNKKVRSQTAKDLVKARNKIIEHIKKSALSASKEGAINFEDLGIDQIIVDEAHEFKKPPISTKMKMKGLNTGTSDRSLALRFLTDYVKQTNNGAGVHVFTGTPITNSLVEIYNMMRYVMDYDMKKVGVNDWDSWFGSFADSVTDIELTTTGEYEPVTRLAAFVNVPELRRIVGQYLDTVFADDMPEFKPRKTSTGKTFADELSSEEANELLNGRNEKPQGRPYKKIINSLSDMTPEQKGILGKLVKLAERFKKATKKERKQIMDAGHEASPLLVETAAANAGMDARLVDMHLSDNKGSKVNRCVENVLKHFNEHPLSTQVIFMERGMSDTREVVKRDGAGNKIKDSNGKSIKEKIPAMNLAKDIVNKLVANGIAREQIAIVSGSTSKEKRTEIADKMNKGEIRVVIGNTKTLGVGVNMQANLRAMHHLDAPWMPGELEQRNGRGHRQGNKWNTVLEYRYLTNKLDGRRWQVLAVKQKFIKAFMQANEDTRIIEGDAVDMQESDDDIGKTLSEATGDPRRMQANKLSNDISKLETRERMHLYGIEDAKDKIKELKNRIRESEKTATAAEADLKQYEAEKQKDFSLELQGKTYESRKDADAALEALAARIKDDPNFNKKDKVYIGKYRGFELYGEDGWFGNTAIIIQGKGEYDAKFSTASLDSILRGIKTRGIKAEEAIETAKDGIAKMEAMTKEPFHQQETLDKKRKMLSDLEADLLANPTPAPEWLLNGAPVGSEVYVEGKPATVEGHRNNNEGTFVVTDKGTFKIDKVTDMNGIPLFDKTSAPDIKMSAGKDQEDAFSDEDLKELLAYRGQNVNFIPEEKTSSAERAIASMGETMGVKVRFFIGESSLRGFHFGDVAYINRKGNRGPAWTFWHEHMHWLRNNDEALYQDVLQAVEDASHVTDKQVESYRDTIALGDKMERSAVVEEMLADELADAVSRRGLLESIATQDKSLFYRLGEFFQKVIAKLKAAASGQEEQRDSHLNLAQVKALEQQVRQAFGLAAVDGKRLYTDRSKFPYKEVPAYSSEEQESEQRNEEDTDIRYSADSSNVRQRASLALGSFAEKMGWRAKENVEKEEEGTNGMNPIKAFLLSPSTLKKSNQAIRFVVNLANKAVERNEDFRNQADRKMQKIEKLLKSKEDRETFTTLLWLGDTTETEWTNQQLRDQGYSDNIVAAYRMFRSTSDYFYRLANDTRQQVQVKSESVTLNSDEEMNKFKIQNLHNQVESNQFNKVLKGERVGDRYVLTWREPRTYTKEIQCTGDELEALQNNPDVQVIKVRGESGAVLDNQQAVVRNAPVLLVTYREQTPAINKRKGYVRHLFNSFMVYSKNEEGEWTSIGSFDSFREATKFANAQDPSGEYAVRGKTFQMPGAAEAAATVGDRQYFKIMGKLEDQFQISAGEAQQLMDGKVKMKNRGRFLGSILQRKGAGGYEMDALKATRRHWHEVSRFVALDPFKRKSISAFERFFGRWDDKHQGDAEFIQGYINDVNGNPTKIEQAFNRVILGTPFLGKMLKMHDFERPGLSLASTTMKITGVLKLGLPNVASSLINLTQLLNAGAVMGDFGAIAKGMKLASGKLSLADRRVLKETGVDANIGLDIGAGYTSAQRFSGGVTKLAMYPFMAAERLCRVSTVLGAYHQGVAKGMNRTEAINYAREVNDKANFNYSIADTPRFMRFGGPLTQMIFQFKKYPVKMLELMREFAPFISNDRTAVEKARFWLPYLAISGLWGVPGFSMLVGPVLGMLLKTLLDAEGDDWETVLKNETFKAAAGNKALEAGVKAVWYGGFSFAGVDISKRAGIGDFGAFGQMPKTGWEAFFTALGPGGNTLYNSVIKGMERDPIGVIQAMSPGLGSVIAATLGRKEDSRGRVKTVYESAYDRAVRGLGFRTMDEAMESDVKRISDDLKKDKGADKRRAIDRYIDDPTPQNLQRLRDLGVKMQSVREEMRKKELTDVDRARKSMTRRDRRDTDYLNDYLID